MSLLIFIVTSQTALAGTLTCEQALKKDKPVVVMYSADYCLYCKRFKPIFFHLSDNMSDKYNFAYYDVTTNKFSRAIAINNIESEACGIVSEVIDNDNFVIISKGLLETDKYNFSVGSKLYLSDVIPGKLVSIEPQSIIKQIAIQATNGIIIDIQRGWKITNTSSSEELEPYTKEELDEIIKNVW